MWMQQFAKGPTKLSKPNITLRIWRTFPWKPPVAVAEYRDGKSAGPGPRPRIRRRCRRTIAQRARHQERGCDVPRHAARWRLRTQVENPTRWRRPAVLSKTTWQAGPKLSGPVKTIFTSIFFHSVAAMYMKAAVGPDGKPTAWFTAHGVSGLSVRPLTPRATYALDEMGLGWNNLPFDIPNHRARKWPPPTSTCALDGCASVANVYHAFRDSLLRRRACQVRQQRFGRSICLISSDRRASSRLSIKEGRCGREAALPARHRPIAARGVEIAAEKSGWG